MKTLEEIFAEGYSFDEPILEAAEKGRLVFFIGAGVSRIMGISGWDEFADKLINKAFKKYNQQKALQSISNSKEKITIAYKEYEKNGSLEEFFDLFGEAMKPDTNKYEQTVKRKGNIYEILNKFQALFLTTNADNLFEEVLGTTFCYDDLSKIGSPNDSRFRETNRLIYLHGHYKKGKGINNKLVFTADSYVERYNDPQYLQFLTKIFGYQENVIVFIGYGLNEFELIDYIVTKTNASRNAQNNRYLLYGFCSNDDILYQAKRAYFETLGITLIPFCLDYDGYESLIDVLRELYEQYDKNVLPPIPESIEDFVLECNDENYEGLLRILKKPESSKIYGDKIFKEMSLHNKKEWVGMLIKKGYYSGKTLTMQLKIKKWPLLEMLIEGVKLGNNEAQDAAVKLLSEINDKHIELLKEQYNYIGNYIAEIILAMDKDHIKDEHLSLLTLMEMNIDKFYRAILWSKSDLKNTFCWGKKIFKKLIEVIFDEIEITKVQEIYFEYAERILKIILQGTADNSYCSEIIIEYFTEKLITISQEQLYGDPLFYKHNLDNIEKHFDTCQYLILEAIRTCFLRMSSTKKYLQKLLRNDSILSKKLALYLMRKSEKKDIIAEIDFAKYDFYSDYHYYTELYLFIRHVCDNSIIASEGADIIAKKIENADWGYFQGMNNITSNDEKYVLSKRLAILQLLPCDYALNKANELLKNGIVPYDAIGVANCDIVRTIEVKDDCKKELETREIKSWIDYLKENLRGNNTYGLLNPEDFVECLSERGIADKIIVINNLNQIPLEQMNGVIWAFSSKIDKVKDIIDRIIIFALSVLREIEGKEKYYYLAKSIFYFFSKALDCCAETNLVKKILEGVDKWMDKSIDEIAYDDIKDDLISYLINLRDFEKISLWIQCLVTLKQAGKQEELDKRIKRLSGFLDTNNRINRYIFCYNYRSLKYLFQNTEEDVFKRLIYPNGLFDIVALEICVSRTYGVENECIETIKKEYLINKNWPKATSGRKTLEECFYRFIIEANYYNKIDDTTILLAFEDRCFLDYYFDGLIMLSNMPNYSLEKQVSRGWEYIKSRNVIMEDDSYSKKILMSIRYLKGGYTENLLNILLEAVANVKSDINFIDLKKYCHFYDVNFDKAHRLIKKIAERSYYIEINIIKQLLDKYKNKKREGTELIKLLENREIITVDQRSQLKKRLERE